LKFTNDNTKKEQNFAAISNEKQYKAHIPLNSLQHNPPHPPHLSGKLELLIGDSFIANSFIWNLGSITITMPEENATLEDVQLQPLKEINHKFRAPDILAKDYLSYTFTIAVITPILILIIGLVLTGVNLKKFPSGIDSISAIVFVGCIGAILGLYTLYWLVFNAFQTLGYLIILSLPTFLSGYRVLSYLSKHHHN